MFCQYDLTHLVGRGRNHRTAARCSRIFLLKVTFYCFPLAPDDMAGVTRGNRTSLEERWNETSSSPRDYNASHAVIRLSVDASFKVRQVDMSVPGPTCTIVSSEQDAKNFLQTSLSSVPCARVPLADPGTRERRGSSRSPRVGISESILSLRSVPSPVSNPRSAFAARHPQPTKLPPALVRASIVEPGIVRTGFVQTRGSLFLHHALPLPGA